MNYGGQTWTFVISCQMKIYQVRVGFALQEFRIEDILIPNQSYFYQ